MKRLSREMRAVLLDFDLVADLVLVLLVVRLEARARDGRTCRRAGRVAT